MASTIRTRIVNYILGDVTGEFNKKTKIITALLAFCFIVAVITLFALLWSFLSQSGSGSSDKICDGSHAKVPELIRINNRDYTLV